VYARHLAHNRIGHPLLQIDPTVLVEGAQLIGNVCIAFT
jgi:hypothetical protein